MMNQWQVQAMREAESSRIWEEMNAPDPCYGKMLEAASSLQVAVKHLDKATDWLADAAGELIGTPMEDVVNSYTLQLENFLCDLKKLREKYGRGER